MCSARCAFLATLLTSESLLHTMHLKFFFLGSCSVFLHAAASALNEPCVYAPGRAGVCVSTSDCTSDGGASIQGACPGTPDNIRCCAKPTCNSGGNCRWSSDCAGTSSSGFCPGPGDFKCCSSASQGFGGYGSPIKHYGSCQEVAKRGSDAIIAAFPGRVREVGCKRECEPGNTSDHCDGKATDMMCSDAGGRATMSGEQIAEWIMNHSSGLSLKYVIWGQKIWSPTRSPPDTPKRWSQWRDMEDRDDLTQNHWDHVHVSYK